MNLPAASTSSAAAHNGSFYISNSPARRPIDGILCVIVLAVLVMQPGMSSAQLGAPISPPGIVNSNAGTDNGLSATDHRPAVATNRQGRWISVWGSNDPNGTSGTDTEIVFAVSDDHGTTWSTAAFLNTDADTETVNDHSPAIATDGVGNWVVVWKRGGSHYAFSRSTDEGQTWSPPSPFLESSTGSAPSISVNSQGTWIVTWGDDSGVVFRVSTDAGMSWSPAESLISCCSRCCEPVEILHGAGQIWGAVFERTVWDPLTSYEVLFSRSADDGVSWSPPVEVSTENETTLIRPRLTTNEAGTWIAFWSADNPNTGELGVKFSRSLDDGVTWSAETTLDGRQNARHPDGLTDVFGNWVVAWSLWGSAAFENTDLVVSTSTDDGLSWSAPEVLVPAGVDTSEQGAEVASAGNSGVLLTTDRRGHWIATWSSVREVAEETFIAGDSDILNVEFILPFVETCAGDLDGDGFGQPGNSGCPRGASADCDDSVYEIHPGADELCDGVSNDCSDPGWPALPASELDADGDSFVACQECNDAEPSVWAQPTPARDLRVEKGPVADSVTLNWLPPLDSGGDGIVSYDVLRAESPADFTDATTVCVESDDGTDTAATDVVQIPPGELRFYLIRARNACPAAVMSLASNGTRRAGRSCP